MSFAEIRSNSFGSVISENNSVKYHIKLVGVHDKIPDNSGIFVNDTKYGLDNRGLNVVKFDENMKFIESVSFDIYDKVDIEGSRFISYVSGADSNSVLGVYTFGAIGNSVNLIRFMNELGSSIWPEWLITGPAYTEENRRFPYCMLYDSKTKNIITEATGSKTSEIPARTEYYIDNIKDLGSIGMGRSLVEDSTEYSGKFYDVKIYQSESPVSTFPQVKQGEYLRLRGDFKRDQEAIDNKVECRLQVQFYDENMSYLEGITLGVFPGLEWETKELMSQITKDVKFIDIGFYHAPVALDGKGEASIRNVVIQTSNEAPKKVKKIRFGRSAPTQVFKEGEISNQPQTVVKFTSDEQIEAKELEELDTGGYWVKVFDHNVLNKDVSFSNKTEARDNLVPYLYSNLKEIENYRGFNGKFKFRLDYETEKGYIVWEQKNSPEDPEVQEVVIIDSKLSHPERVFLGLKLSDSEDYVYESDEGWFTIGSVNLWNEGIKADNDIPSRYTRLSVWKD